MGYYVLIETKHTNKVRQIMTTYTITEKQNINSIRDGYDVELSDLKAAKRHASYNQMFFGTVMVIEEDGCVVATKAGNGKWRA